jgi:hypothetical protein
LRHPDGAGSVYPAGGHAGSATAVGPDIFQLKFWVSARTLGAAHQAVEQAQQYVTGGYRLVVDLDLEKV